MYLSGIDLILKTGCYIPKWSHVVGDALKNKMAEKQNWASYFILIKVYEERGLFSLKEHAQMNNAQ